MRVDDFFDNVPGELTELACTVNRYHLQKIALYRARREADLWPFCSMQAHRYARRKLRELERANGELENLEWALAYEQLMGVYINDPKNW